jgi:hypothetical protein
MARGEHIPSLRQRTWSTHGSAGNLYGAFGSTLLNVILLDAPPSLVIESLWCRDVPLASDTKLLLLVLKSISNEIES